MNFCRDIILVEVRKVNLPRLAVSTQSTNVTNGQTDRQNCTYDETICYCIAR